MGPRETSIFVFGAIINRWSSFRQAAGGGGKGTVDGILNNPLIVHNVICSLVLGLGLVLFCFFTLRYSIHR